MKNGLQLSFQWYLCKRYLVNEIFDIRIIHIYYYLELMNFDYFLSDNSTHFNWSFSLMKWINLNSKQVHIFHLYYWIDIITFIINGLFTLLTVAIYSNLKILTFLVKSLAILILLFSSCYSHLAILVEWYL